MKPHSVTVSTTDFDSVSEGSNPSEVATHLYRFDGIRYATSVDVDGEPLPGKGDRRIWLSRYEILKTTAKGVWINAGGGKNGKFVNLTARKQFACRSKAEAMQSFIARKQTEIRILDSRLEDARTFLKLAQEGKYDE